MTGARAKLALISPQHHIVGYHPLRPVVLSSPRRPYMPYGWIAYNIESRNVCVAQWASTSLR